MDSAGMRTADWDILKEPEGLITVKSLKKFNEND